MKRFLESMFGLVVWLLLPAFLFAQDTVNLKEIRVSSVANPVNQKEIPRMIGIVSSNEIKSIPATSVGDILTQAAGLDVRSRGVYGMQQDLSMEGGSFDQTLVLINGIPVNDPQTGHHNLDQALVLQNIVKIEIVHGPSSRWFGPNAFSGAINIITRQTAGNHLTIGLQAGQYGLFTSSLSAGYTTGKIMNQTVVSFSRSNGYRINTDFKNTVFSHNSFFSAGSTRFNLQLGYAAKAFGANSFYTARFPDQYEKIKVMSAALGVQGGKKIKFNGNIRWRRLYDRFELFREGNGWYQKQGDWYVKDGDSAGFHTPAGFFPYRGPNFHRTDMAGGQGSATLSSVAGKTTAGFSYQYDHIFSNVLGEPMHDTLFSKMDSRAWYNHQKGRQQLNFYVNQLYQRKTLSMSGGINLFYSPDYGAMLSPGLDVSWFATRNLKTFFSLNRGIRLPTFTDLYYTGPDHISNPHLKPEKVYGIAVGTQYFLKNFTFSTRFFYHKGQNIIDWVKKEATSPWESKNLTSLNTFGAGFSVEYLPPQGKRKFLQRVRAGYRYLYSDKKAEGYVSLYALEYLRHHFTLSLQHRIAHRLSAAWTFSIEKRNGHYFDYEQQQSMPYRTVFLLNTKIRYTLPHFNFFLQANNLLNQTYRDIGSVIMPGLWVSGGVAYHVSLKKKE